MGRQSTFGLIHFPYFLPIVRTLYRTTEYLNLVGSMASSGSAFSHCLIANWHYFKFYKKGSAKATFNPCCDIHIYNCDFWVFSWK